MEHSQGLAETILEYVSIPEHSTPVSMRRSLADLRVIIPGCRLNDEALLCLVVIAACHAHRPIDFDITPALEGVHSGPG